jgi:triosephosphate isomerase
MHKTVLEATAFVRELGTALKDLAATVEVVVAPPFTALAPAAEVARSLPVALAGQDVYFEREGAFFS